MELYPGRCLICGSCNHLIGEAFDQGHPTPCKPVRWDGVRQIQPTLSIGGRACSRFELAPDWRRRERTAGTAPSSTIDAGPV